MKNTIQADWDSRSEQVLNDQRSAFDHMREHCPVALGTDGRWSLFRHADVMQALMQPENFSSRVSQHISVPNGMDPPEHGPYRELINPYFSQARVDAFAPVCRVIAEELATQLRRSATCELMNDFARPFAARIQCAFMGWPDTLAADLLDWLERSQNATLTRDRPLLTQLADEFARLVNGQLQSRHGLPPDTDVTCQLMHEQIQGRQLNHEEITSILRNWTAGEVGTIAAAIGIIAHFLATHPELQQQLRQNPEKLLYANDEIQRLYNPLLENRRRTRCPVQMGQRQIPAQETLILNWVSANRDPAVFANADQFAWDRNPADNLLYGAGLHYYPGAPLARMELVTAINSLLQHCQNLQLLPDRQPRHARYPASGYASLHLCLQA